MMRNRAVDDAFAAALAHVLRWEGGYVDDPDDPGGATKFGLALNRIGRTLGLRHKHEITGLTIDAAAEIYRKHYWRAACCDQLAALSRPGLALAVFDTAVNQGVGRACRLLQRAARVKADGVIGPVTLAAVEAADARALLQEFMVRRALHYTGLVKFGKYGLGWLRRVFDTFAAALEVQSQRGKP